MMFFILWEFEEVVLIRNGDFLHYVCDDACASLEELVNVFRLLEGEWVSTYSLIVDSVKKGDWQVTSKTQLGIYLTLGKAF